MKKIVNEYTFIEVLKKRRRTEISRGYVIDLLADIRDKWANIIRALIMGDSNMFVPCQYLIEKVRYCQLHPNNPEIFLDYKRLKIFKALELK